MSAKVGKIVQVIGPVIDVSFGLEGGTLPNILEALEVVRLLLPESGIYRSSERRDES